MGVLQYCIQADAPHARYSTTHRPPPVTLKSSTALYYDTMLTTTSSIQLVWLGGREKLSHTTLSRFSTVAPTKRREEMRREGGVGEERIRYGGSSNSIISVSGRCGRRRSRSRSRSRSKSRRRGRLSGKCGKSRSRLSAYAAGGRS